eukprot:2232431-Rhodomonas_salina.1
MSETRFGDDSWTISTPVAFVLGEQTATPERTRTHCNSSLFVCGPLTFYASFENRENVSVPTFACTGYGTCEIVGATTQYLTAVVATSPITNRTSRSTSRI